MPGVPHILVYQDTFEKLKYASIIKKRSLLKDITGGEDIVAWVNQGFKLEIKK